MIWLYITAAIVAQAIVVVLLVEYVNRRSSPTVEKENAPEPKESTDNSSEVPMEKDGPKQTPSDEESAVGLTAFSAEEFRAMREEIRSLRECVETLIDIKDVEFDEKVKAKSETKKDVPDARMSPEAEMKAWEDHRDEIAQLDKEDDTVAPPNPLASGADFDALTKATVIFETADGQTPEDLQFAINIYKTVEGTQFCGCLPDALLDKLQECHRRVEMKTEILREDNTRDDSKEVEPQPIPEKQETEKKPEPERTDAQDRKPEQEAVSEPQPAPKRFSMDFVRKHTPNN